MLQSRDDIRKDNAVDAFTDAILQRDQPRTAELFFNLVRGRPLDGRRAQRGDGGGGAVRAGAQSRRCARRADHADQQRPHHPGPAHLGRSDAVSAGRVPPARDAAERVVHPGRSRHLEPVARQVSRPLRHDEGHERAAAELWAGGVERRPGADRRGRRVRGPAARAHDRDDERRREALLWSVPWPRGRRSGAAEAARPDAVPRADRPAGHRDGPQGAQHRPQGAACPRRGRSRRAYRLGARARRLLYRRAGHGDRAAVLLAVRRRLRDGDRGVSRRRQEPEADQSGERCRRSRSRT